MSFEQRSSSDLINQTPNSGLLKENKLYTPSDKQKEALSLGDAEQLESQIEAAALIAFEEADFYSIDCVQQLYKAGLSLDFIETLSENENLQKKISEARDMDIEEPIEIKTHEIKDLRSQQENQTQEQENQTQEQENKIQELKENQLDYKDDQLDYKDNQLDYKNKIIEKNISLLKAFEATEDKTTFIAQQIKELESLPEKQIKETDLGKTLDVMKKFRDATTFPENENIPKEDQARVNTLLNQSVTSLDPKGIISFCQAVQNDETLSVETKRHVLKNMGVESTILNGADANNLLNTTSIDPKTGKKISVFTENNPVEIQGDLKMYVNKKGEKVVKMKGQDEIPLSGNNGPEDEGIRQRLRFAIVQNILNQSLNGQSYLLLGGGANTEESQMYESSRKNADMLLQAALPAGSATSIEGRIPNEQDLIYLSKFMNTVTHDKSIGGTQMKNDMLALGLIKGPGEINISRANAIGDILQNEDYYDALNNTRLDDTAYDTMLIETDLMDM